jgi:hypothetical protein
VANAVHIRGLKELDRAFGRVNKGVQSGMRAELQKAAEPVARTAEEYALREVTNIGSAWSMMRSVAKSGSVYVAPQKRGRKKGPQKRPNLATLLMDRAMEPALEKEGPGVVEKVEDLVDRWSLAEGFG